MHAESQSINLSLRETAPFRPWNPPPIAPESLQGVGRSLWDLVFLTLLFSVKASPVSQKLLALIECSLPADLLGKSVVKKRVLRLMCGSGSHHCVLPSCEMTKPQIPRFESRCHHLFLWSPWAGYLHSLWLSFKRKVQEGGDIYILIADSPLSYRRN